MLDEKRIVNRVFKAISDYSTSIPFIPLKVSDLTRRSLLLATRGADSIGSAIYDHDGRMVQSFYDPFDTRYYTYNADGLVNSVTLAQSAKIYRIERNLDIYVNMCGYDVEKWVYDKERQVFEWGIGDSLEYVVDETTVKLRSKNKITRVIEFDDRDNIIKIEYPGGRNVITRYEYDKNDMLINIISFMDDKTDDMTPVVEYKANGAPSILKAQTREGEKLIIYLYE